MINEKQKLENITRVIVVSISKPDVYQINLRSVCKINSIPGVQEHF